MVCSITYKKTSLSVVSKTILLFLPVLFFVIFLTQEFSIVYAAEGRVWHIEDKNKDTIDFGVVFLGDSVSQKFLLQNYSNKTYKILGKSPSYIRRSVLGGDDFRYLHFLPKNNQVPIFDIKPNSPPDTVTIYFKDKLNNDDATGVMEAILELGMVDETYPETDPKHLVVADTFLLVGRKTDKLIAARDENIEFDSVYINPNTPTVTKVWNIRNVWRDRLKIESDDLKLITTELTGKEIEITRFPVPYELQERSNYFSYLITYTPRDFYKDTAIYKMYYYNDINSNNQGRRLDSIVTYISGVGVQQDLKINYVDKGNTFYKSKDKAEPNTWIIELGNIHINEDFTFSVILENPSLSSNTPIGKTSETFSQKYNRQDLITLEKAFIADGKYLKVDKKDTLKFKINLTKTGTFEIEYNLKTNLRNRKIVNFRNENENFKIVFKGVGVSGGFLKNKDSINFGSVNIVGTCPLSVSDSIEITNVGNADLDLQFIPIGNFNSFSFGTATNTLPAGEKTNLIITFTPLDEIEYRATLGIVYNTGNKSDTSKVVLMGQGISKLTSKLYVKDISYKPGSIVEIPILVEGKKIKYSSRFLSTFRYDRSMLEFIDYLSNQTASNSLSLDSKITEIQEDKYDKLDIDLRTSANSNFLNSDTLIILRFNSYLGDKLQSNLEFFSAKIGNENCQEIIGVDKTDGVLTLDSVCGVEYKVRQRSQIFKNKISSLTPNPASEKIDIEFDINQEGYTKIQLFNTFGDLVQEVFKGELMKGKHKQNINITGLNNGVYFLHFYSGKNAETYPFIKN